MTLMCHSLLVIDGRARMSAGSACTRARQSTASSLTCYHITLVHALSISRLHKLKAKLVSLAPKRATVLAVCVRGALVHR